MNLYLYKNVWYEARYPSERTLWEKAFMFVLAHTKEQCIERIHAMMPFRERRDI